MGCRASCAVCSGHIVKLLLRTRAARSVPHLQATPQHTRVTSTKWATTIMKLVHQGSALGKGLGFSIHTGQLPSSRLQRLQRFSTELLHLVGGVAALEGQTANLN